MSRKKIDSNLTPAELKKLAKKIISENPIYMPDEPTSVGSPDNIIDEEENIEDEESSAKKSERSKK
ncbi:hypothetical protein ACSV5M_14140 [Cellvibrio sp. ARAG 10.3]|uniref:hypothetical protein n=1 Tax=Cellvibrio sp. ARAG 10.3 TaxID=3451358 RepID=UPI003F462D9A